MRLRCPNCHEVLDEEMLTCARGHRFAYEDGVLVLLEAGFHHYLQGYLPVLTARRGQDQKRLLDPSIYESLPFGAAVAGNFEWRMRQYDLRVILGLLAGRGPQRVLDVGAWNGWLSHQLARRGHEVTAVDHFVDAYDGLGARKFYSSQWQAIQMDLSDLAPLDGCFDVVVLNRCVQFFTAPVDYVAAARQKVAPGGLLILIGLQFFQDASVKAAQMARLQAEFRAQSGFELFLKPTKGYLGFEEKRLLAAQGVRLALYRDLWLANLRSVVDRRRPRHYYGVWDG